MKFRSWVIKLCLILIYIILVQGQTTDTAENGSNIEKKFKKVFSYVSYSMIQSFLLIFTSQLGDNTFILCLIFTKEVSKLSIFMIATTSLLLMNIFSICLGWSIPFFLYKKLIPWFAIFVLVLYGLWLFDESRSIVDYEDGKEEDGVDQEARLVEHKDHYIEPRIPRKLKKISSGFMNYYSLRKSRLPTSKNRMALSIPEYIPKNQIKEKDQEMDQEEDNERFVKTEALETSLISENIKTEAEVTSSLFWKFFSSIMVGECGDRSQICTIVIASIYNPFGVIIGTSLAHIASVICSIFMGKFVTKYISERATMIASGVLLIIYAVDIYLFRLV